MCDIERRAYYINDEGIGKSKEYRQKMVKKALKFAKSIIENDKTAHNVILFCSMRENGYLWMRDSTFDKLWTNGEEHNNIRYYATSLKTYCKCNGYNDIVICMGCVSSALKSLDKYKDIGYVISVPWTKQSSMEWIVENNAMEIE